MCDEGLRWSVSWSGAVCPALGKEASDKGLGWGHPGTGSAGLREQKGTSAQPHGFQSKVCAKTDLDQCNWPTLGVADGQESLACYNPLGRKQSDTAELN